jgi:hypothetical protein
MLTGRLVAFHRWATIPEPKPAKATLRSDVQASVQRSMHKLPMLGERNPDAAILIERSIDDFMPPPDNEGGDHAPADPPHHGAGNDHTPEARTHRCLMEMLVEIHGDLSVAS